MAYCRSKRPREGDGRGTRIDNVEDADVVECREKEVSAEEQVLKERLDSVTSAVVGVVVDEQVDMEVDLGVVASRIGGVVASQTFFRFFGEDVMTTSSSSTTECTLTVLLCSVSNCSGRGIDKSAFILFVMIAARSFRLVCSLDQDQRE